ncbi:hypothetical protein [Methylobacterium sp. J-070]|uniref:hypothetical protein n=1 Tax=Methylobacterium sp. J-070 TaxID=2836650 RepID=UPI001FBBAA98|nr:hypothetical protein [Methylobacterium sp. J-070]MCJ2051002.1 hypothetical protein [Methylobacterium sp. J-070]
MAASLYDLGLLAVNGFANENEAEAANFDRLKWLRLELSSSEKLSQIEKPELDALFRDLDVIFDGFSNLISSAPTSQVIKDVFRFRLARIIDNVFQIGSYDTGRYVGLIASDNANRAKAEKATAKNRQLREFIENEARAKGLALKNSDKFAQRLEAGVRARAGVNAGAEGFGWPTIRREIKAIIVEKKGQTSA